MKRADMRADLDAALAGVRLSEERKAAILAAVKEGKQVTKRQWTLRTTLVAAALCAALAVTALAVSPTLRQALEDLLGDFEPYSQTVEGVSAADQGIQISVVKAIADETDGKYYLEVKDLTGDRLDAGTVLSVKGGCYIKAYDPETRTALFEGSLGNSGRDGSGTATVTVTEVWGCRDFSGVSLPGELLDAGNVLRSYEAPVETAAWVATDAAGHKTYDDTTVLYPNQTPGALEGTDDFTLSSMGYDKNGKLHIQIALAEGVGVPEWSFYPWFYDKDGGEDSMAFGLTGHSTELEGGKYVDFRIDPYENEPLTAADFQRAGLILRGEIATKPKVEGEWTLAFPLEPLPERTFAVGQQVNGLTVDTITLSALNVHLKGTFSETAHGSLGSQPMAVYLADGSTVAIPRGRIIDIDSRDGSGDRSFRNRWSYEEPVEPEEVVGLAIGYWYIPLEGNAALPGRWLAELPDP